jgi:hypothetical protein
MARPVWVFESIRAEAERAGASEAHNGRPGWLWEGILSTRVAMLWDRLGAHGSEHARGSLRERFFD